MDLKSRENMSQEGMSVYNHVYVCIMEGLHYINYLAYLVWKLAEGEGTILMAVKTWTALRPWYENLGDEEMRVKQSKKE
jgi:hypothetical protein